MNTVTSQTRQRLYTLTKTTESFEVKVENWARAKSDHTEKVYKENATIMTKGEDTIQHLRRNYQDILTNISNLGQKLKQECEKEDLLKHSIKNMKESEKQHSNEIPSLVNQLSQVSLQYQETESMVHRQMEQRNGKQQEMENKVKMIQKYLGLYFEQVPEENLVRVAFINVDPIAPQKRFTFCVRASPNAYQVSKFNPPIQIPSEYLQDLNLSNNFARFLVQIRKMYSMDFQNQ